jgi:hypothetical protein
VLVIVQISSLVFTNLILIAKFNLELSEILSEETKDFLIFEVNLNDTSLASI